MGTICMLNLSKYIMTGVVYNCIFIQSVNFTTLGLFKQQAYTGNGGAEK